MSRVALVVAVARNGVIGRDGGLPWHIPSDLKRFKAVTLGKPIIMGRRTWESLPKKPLPGRRNIVVTRNSGFLAEGADVAATPEAALAIARAENSDEICVIGGGDIYRLFFPLADRLYLTEVDLAVDGDTRFPAVDPAIWREASRETVPRGPNDSAGFTLRVLDRAT
ncbi:MAG: dihydrofolate reductase [Proteobacteria bacterium]|nr:dihydrofolate reductase [Pseudomonadota bacterium]